MLSGHGAGEQVWLLQHHAHLPCQRAAGHLAYVVPVHQDAALGHVGEAVDQSDHRALPGPRGADDGDVFAGTDVQVDILEHVYARHIVEIDVLEAYLALDLRQFLGVRFVLDLGFQVQHLEDADAGGHGPL